MFLMVWGTRKDLGTPLYKFAGIYMQVFKAESQFEIFQHYKLDKIELFQLCCVCGVFWTPWASEVLRVSQRFPSIVDKLDCKSFGSLSWEASLNTLSTNSARGKSRKERFSRVRHKAETRRCWSPHLLHQSCWSACITNIKLGLGTSHFLNIPFSPSTRTCTTSCIQEFAGTVQDAGPGSAGGEK